MVTPAPAHVLAAIDLNRRRVWTLCYRMTGSRADADDLAQEAAARAIERADQAADGDASGWLLRLSTRVCLDHLRHRKIVRRVTALVDPLDMPELPAGEPRGPNAEENALLREDVRFAVMVALQRLSPRQRAALVLCDVCDRSLEEAADALGTNANAVKALLHRARVTLARARRRSDVDAPVDPAIVERFARAIEAGAIDALTELLAEDVWGVTDGGGVIKTSTKPNVGRRAVSRQWANAKRRLGQDVLAEVRRINGELAIVVRLAAAPGVVIAVVHLETRAAHVASLRVNRDPSRTALLVPLG